MTLEAQRLDSNDFGSSASKLSDLIRMTLGIDSDDFGSSASKLSDLILMTLRIDSNVFGSNLVVSKLILSRIFRQILSYLQ